MFTRPYITFSQEMNCVGERTTSREFYKYAEILKCTMNIISIPCRGKVTKNENNVENACGYNKILLSIVKINRASFFLGTLNDCNQMLNKQLSENTQILFKT